MKIYHLLFLSIILFSQLTLGAYIEKVKGKKILIVLDGTDLSVGEMVESINPSGGQKKTATLKVTKVKDGKAIAQLIRGKAKINQQIQASSTSSEPQTSNDLPTSRKKPSSKANSNPSTFAVGGLFGVGFDTMEISIGSPAETITQTGMGLSLLGAADYRLTDWFSIRGLLGIEQFNVKGDSKLPTTTQCESCEAKFTYFTGMGWGRVHAFESAWVGIGLGLQHPLSNTSNALDPAAIGTSVVYAFGGGIDIAFSESMYFPIQLEYGMQPKSESVAPSYYGVRLGVMLRY